MGRIDIVYKLILDSEINIQYIVLISKCCIYSFLMNNFQSHKKKKMCTNNSQLATITIINVTKPNATLYVCLYIYAERQREFPARNHQEG